MPAVTWYQERPGDIVLLEYVLPFRSEYENMVKYELQIKRLTPDNKRKPYRISVHEWVCYERDYDHMAATIKGGHVPPDVTLRIYDPELFTHE